MAERWSTIRAGLSRVRPRYMIAFLIAAILLVSEVTITVEPKWKARQDRRNDEALAHIALTIDQLNDRIYALEQTDAVAFGLVAEAFGRPARGAAAAAAQRQHLQEQIEEIARQQRV